MGAIFFTYFPYLELYIGIKYKLKFGDSQAESINRTFYSNTLSIEPSRDVLYIFNGLEILFGIALSGEPS